MPHPLPRGARVYLAGPMSGLPDYNLAAFRYASRFLREVSGLHVYNPHEADAELDGFDATRDEALPHRHYMRRDLAWITEHADAVVVLPGWQDSRGARLEVHAAMVCDIPVLRYADLERIDVHVQVAVTAKAGDGDTVRTVFDPPVHVEAGQACTTTIRVPLHMAPAEAAPAVDEHDAPPFPDEAPYPPAVGEPGPVMRRLVGLAADRLAAGLTELSKQPCDIGCGPKCGCRTAADTDPAGRRIVTDPDTGARKETRLERPDLIPVGPLRAVARHYGIGATKYAERNWEAGYLWSLSYGALMRHLMAWWAGEDEDLVVMDDGSTFTTPHLAAAAFHVLALMEFAWTHPEKDDRPGRPR